MFFVDITKVDSGINECDSWLRTTNSGITPRNLIKHVFVFDVNFFIKKSHYRLSNSHSYSTR